MYKCRNNEGTFKFSDKPCNKDEKNIFTKKEKEASILIKKMGQAMYDMLNDKAKSGDDKAKEIIRIMESIEFSKLYTHTKTFPIVINACKKHDEDLGTEMENTFNVFLKSNSSYIKSGNRIFLNGISSEILTDANATPDMMEKSLNKKIDELKKKYNNRNINGLINDCNKTNKLMHLLST
jgi:hypothetical protein